MRVADRLRSDSGFDRDLADLIDAGSSLGGARPKAAVISSSGRLTIAKFPHARLSTAIDFDDATASIEMALDVSDHFRLSATAALGLVGEVERATSGWRDVAKQLGLPGPEIELMTTAYETEQRRVARTVAAGVTD